MIDKYLKARDLSSVLATDHNQTLLHSSVTFTTPQDNLFGDNSSCVLQPNMTLAEGPCCEFEYFMLDLTSN